MLSILLVLINLGWANNSSSGRTHQPQSRSPLIRHPSNSSSCLELELTVHLPQTRGDCVSGDDCAASVRRRCAGSIADALAERVRRVHHKERKCRLADRVWAPLAHVSHPWYAPLAGTCRKLHVSNCISKADSANLNSPPNPVRLSLLVLPSSYH